MTNTNVARFLDQQVKENPEAPALKIPRRNKDTLTYETYSFGELDNLVGLRRKALQEQGIRTGTRTLLLVKPGLDLIVTVFALFKEGAIPIVIDPGMGLRGFLRCVRHTRPEALVAIPVGQMISWVFWGSFDSVKNRLWIRRGALSVKIAERSSEPAVSRDKNAEAAILFTSGSTGPAKGVTYTHGMFDAQVRLIRETWEIQPGEVDLPMLPVFALFNPALGMTTIIPEINPSRPATVNPAKIVEALENDRITNSFGSPVLWKIITSYAKKKGLRLPGPRRILMAGAPVPASLHAKVQKYIPGAQTFTPYGATEALPVSSISGEEVLQITSALTRQGKGTCVGRPVKGMEVQIIEWNEAPRKQVSSQDFLSTGKIGEIIVRGPVVTETYDNLPEATAKAKIPSDQGIWHRMGDMGYFDDEGLLWFCGRAAEQVLTSSGPVFTDCVEGLFQDFPGVNRVALIGLGPAGEQVPALVAEPEIWPRKRKEKEALFEALQKRAGKNPLSAKLERFFLKRKFPVDVRHNAKIHRLTLKKHFDRRT
ncbi:MAG: AMP-binding protein [Opitutales bacterium]|nr:AMP-binding protein [Opitutales bacterium]MCH8539584.1 AMP-binding protein [Opitutales bacterium]